MRVYDALTYAGNRESLVDLEDDTRFEFVHGDICDRDAVRSAMEGCDQVVHFAAESHVDRSLLDPDVFVRTNCSGTNVLCDTAVQLGVERFVHISTDEVYGSIEQGSFTETDPLQPRSPYSAAKAGSDLIALAYHETYELPVVVTRSSNQFGPYQFPEKLIPFFVTTLLEGGRVPLYGDGLNIRDWLFVARQLHRGRPGASGGHGRADLQHRCRQREDQPRDHRHHPGGARQGRVRRRVRRGSQGPRSPLLDRRRQGRPARLEAGPHVRGGDRRDDPLVRGQPRMVGPVA
ncbi:MAG: GDP-mannose 4,6-dehydratase [Microthrixaceae bacterium]